MSFTSLNDLYFIGAGLLSYNILWEILVDSGIIYVPFIIAIGEAFGDGMKGGRGMSDPMMVLKSVEYKVYGILLALVLGGMPILQFESGDGDVIVPYARSCQNNERIVLDEDLSKQDEVTTGYGGTGSLNADNLMLQINGQEVRVPVLMALAFSWGNGASLEAVKRLPCSINLTAVSDKLLNLKIADGALLLETKAFVKQCYRRALSAANASGAALPWNTNIHNDSMVGTQPWPGHEVFLNDAYYGNVNRGYVSQSLVAGYQRSAHNRLNAAWAKSADEDVPNGIHTQGGYPSCREWWQGLSSGSDNASFSSANESLRSRLIANLDNYDGLREDIEDVYEWHAPGATQRELEDGLLENTYFNNYALSDIENAETRDYGDQTEGVGSAIMGMFSRALGTIGNAFDTIPSYAGASLVQLGAPIIKGMLLFAFIVVAPLAFIVSSGSIKFMVSYHALLFSIMLWPFLWEMSIWIQQSYVREVMGEAGLKALTEFNSTTMMYKFTDAMFIAFPSILTIVLTTAGLKAGGGVAGMTSMGASSASSAGKTGASKAGSVASKAGGAAKTVATKGKG